MSDEKLENEEMLEPEVTTDAAETVEVSADENVAVEEEYMPNFSYTHHDKEHEFPEWVRSAIQNKEHEDQLREWATASAGLPELKEKLTTRSSKAKELEEQLVNLTGGLSDIKELRDKGDLRGVFGRLGIKEEDFMKFAVELAKEDELPEEQRDFVRQKREFETQQRDWEQKQVQEQQRQFNSQVENDYRRLMNTINTGKYGDLNKVMASKNINMAEEICLVGRHHEMASGTVPAMEDCVDRVFEKYSHLLELNKPQEPVVQKATLPSLKGNNATAVKPKVRSIEDIEKAYNALAGD